MAHRLPMSSGQSPMMPFPAQPYMFHGDAMQVPMITGSSDIPKQVQSRIVAVIGTGWFGRALSKRLAAANVAVVLGSRNPADVRFDVACPVRTNSEALCSAAIVVLAIPREAHAAFAAENGAYLQGKTVVDISNSPTPGAALELQRQLPGSSVVKSLNNVSAYALEGHSRSHAQVMMSGSAQAKRELQDLILTPLGMRAVDYGELSASIGQEKSVFRLFDSYYVPLAISFIVWAFWLVYSILWYLVWDFPGFGTPLNKPRQFPLFIMSKVFAETGISLLALTYLPGCIAAIVQLVRGTAKVPFPWVLAKWLSMRKELGRIAFWNVIVHAIMSCLLVSKDYFYYPMYMHDPLNPNGEPDNMMTAVAETSLLFGVLAFSTFLLVALSSIASVAQELSWREWNFVQSKLGLVGLIFAVIHAWLYASTWTMCDICPKWGNWEAYPLQAAPPVWFGPGLAIVVIGLRFLLALPGVSHRIAKIRRG